MSSIAHPAAAGNLAGYVSNPIMLPGKDPIFAPATLKSGQVYEAGSVLGRITAGAVSSAAKSGGNTGNGTLTLDATNPKRLGVKAGVYTARCIVADTNAATFEVQDPDGFVLGTVDTGGTFDDDIKFALADGATDFVVGDGFDITVAAGSNKLTLALAAAQDGSADPFAVLLERVDATSADKNCPVAVEGTFNEEALVYGTGHTADTVRYALRKLGIHIRTMKYSG